VVFAKKVKQRTENGLQKYQKDTLLKLLITFLKFVRLFFK